MIDLAAPYVLLRRSKSRAKSAQRFHGKATDETKEKDSYEQKFR
jgi:hypothetical protein